MNLQTGKKKKKKKKVTWHGCTISGVDHCKPHRCAWSAGAGAVALELHLCFLNYNWLEGEVMDSRVTKCMHKLRIIYIHIVFKLPCEILFRLDWHLYFHSIDCINLAMFEVYTYSSHNFHVKFWFGLDWHLYLHSSDFLN